jgi:hypothetical protein
MDTSGTLLLTSILDLSKTEERKRGVVEYMSTTRDCYLSLLKTRDDLELSDSDWGVLVRETSKTHPSFFKGMFITTNFWLMSSQQLLNRDDVLRRISHESAEIDAKSRTIILPKRVGSMGVFELMRLMLSIQRCFITIGIAHRWAVYGENLVTRLFMEIIIKSVDGTTTPLHDIIPELVFEFRWFAEKGSFRWYLESNPPLLVLFEALVGKREYYRNIPVSLTQSQLAKKLSADHGLKAGYFIVEVEGYSILDRGYLDVINAISSSADDIRDLYKYAINMGKKLGDLANEPHLSQSDRKLCEGGETSFTITIISAPLILVEMLEEHIREHADESRIHGLRTRCFGKERRLNDGEIEVSNPSEFPTHLDTEDGVIKLIRFLWDLLKVVIAISKLIPKGLWSRELIYDLIEHRKWIWLWPGLTKSAKRSLLKRVLLASANNRYIKEMVHANVPLRILLRAIKEYLHFW